MENKKIIAMNWRNTGEATIGFIAIDQDKGDGRWRSYIGIAPGSDETVDAQYIADWGAKLNKREAMAFFPELPADLFDEEK